MKLDEFISGVLKDINNGLLEAKTTTDRTYYTTHSGVQFDIALTVGNASDIQAEGKARVGIIEVLGAGVGASVQSKQESSEVSRIQFTVHFPPRTNSEDAADRAELQEAKRGSLLDKYEF